MRANVYAVKDIMTTELVTLSEDDDLALADTIFALGRLRHLPVVRDGKLVGLVTHRDLLRCQAERGLAGAKSTLAGAVMTREVVTATPDLPLRKAARILVKNKFGCLPVVVPGGKLVGIVTEADVARFTAMVLDELDKLTGTLVAAEKNR